MNCTQRILRTTRILRTHIIVSVEVLVQVSARDAAKEMGSGRLCPQND